MNKTRTPARRCICGKRSAPKRRQCWTCAKTLWRAKHPLHDAFLNLQSNAKRRGKEVAIKLSEFMAWATETGYAEGRGRTGDKFHIDRIKWWKGYTLDNIQLLTCRDNSIKANIEKRAMAIDRDWQPF